MKIDAVDFFYLAMPEVTTEADGSQDALLVRVAAGGHVGWGECEASPLVSIAAFVCPMSHGVCRPVSDSVLGQTHRRPGGHRAHRRGGRVQQHGPAAGAAHLLRHRDGAVGSPRARREASRSGSCSAISSPTRRRPMPRSSSATRRRRRWSAARRRARTGFRAVKFGWGPIGRGTRRGAMPITFRRRAKALGPDGILLVDVGQIWGEDVEAAAARLPALEAARRGLARGAVLCAARSRPTARSRSAAARREARRRRGRHNVSMARHLIDYRQASASSRSIAAASAASGRRSRSPTTRWRAASPSSTTPSRRIWR